MEKAYESKQIYAFKKILECSKSASISLWYHGDGQRSLFETILQSNDEGSSQFISLIWVMCKIWEDDTILNQVCAKKKRTKVTI